MIDFHVHPLSMKSAKDYIINLSKTHPNSTVAFVNHGFMYPIAELKTYGLYNNITVLHAFGIKCKENIELIVHNPNRQAKEFLKSISNIKCNWIAMIIDLLIRNNINIHPGILLKNTGKKIYEIEIFDLAVELGNPIYNNKDCENVETALKTHIYPLIHQYPMIRPWAEELIPIMDKNEVYIVCSDDDSLLDVENNVFDLASGYIYNEHTPSLIIEEVARKDPRHMDKKWYTGSNTWV